MPRPIGVTLLSVLYLAGAVFWVYFAMTFLIWPEEGDPDGEVTLMILAGGTFFFACTITLTASTGIGLWKLQNWARMIAISLSALTALSILPSWLFTPSIDRTLMLMLLMTPGAYLLSPSVVRTFKPSNTEPPESPES